MRLCASTDIKISGNNAITKIGYNEVRSLEEPAYNVRQNNSSNNKKQKKWTKKKNQNKNSNESKAATATTLYRNCLFNFQSSYSLLYLRAVCGTYALGDDTTRYALVVAEYYGTGLPAILLIVILRFGACFETTVSSVARRPCFHDRNYEQCDTKSDSLKERNASREVFAYLCRSNSKSIRQWKRNALVIFH
jgi:magnesium-transporting ATPase (P-type)